MPFLVEDAWLPATLTMGLMSDEEFAGLVAEHPDLLFEMTASGELLIMPPNFTKTGFQNNEISFQLTAWARTHSAGKVGDSSTGFNLPDGSRRSPDAFWLSNERIRGVGQDGRRRYYRVCPDFVIELRSETDRLNALREKMREWIDNGAELAWLVDPERRAVEIYRPRQEPEIIERAQSVQGEGPVSGFTLDLEAVWNAEK